MFWSDWVVVVDEVVVAVAVVVGSVLSMVSCVFLVLYVFFCVLLKGVKMCRCDIGVCFVIGWRFPGTGEPVPLFSGVRVVFWCFGLRASHLIRM